MAAEQALEFPFFTEDTGGVPPDVHLEIPRGSRQRTDHYRGKARITSRRSVHYTYQWPLDYVGSDAISVKLNGLGAPESAYVKNREATVQLGKGAVTLAAYQDFPWALGSPRDMLRSERTREEAVSAVLDDIDSLFGSGLVYDLEGHSTGGRTAVAVAEKSPERIRGLKLVNSAAVVEGQGTLDYLARIKAFFGDELVDDFDVLRHHFHRPKALADFARYNLGDLFLLAGETFSISNDDIIERVKELDPSVQASALDTLADRLTPNKSVEATLGGVLDLYRMHPNPWIGHLGMQVHPVEMAMELYAMDRELNPHEVQAPRLFAVRALRRKTTPERHSRFPFFKDAA